MRLLDRGAGRGGAGEQPEHGNGTAGRPLALGALALGAFAIGVTEFVIAGVLPAVARSFSVSIPTAGLLVSGYALGVVVGAPLVTAGVLGLPRKRVLLLLLVVFVAGNVVTAAAPSYLVVLSGRVLAALCHGAFLGIGSIVAAELASPQRRARAIAAMFTGITVANVAGVPLGTLIGQHLGWRATFWAIAGLGVVSAAAIAAFVPVLSSADTTPVREELSAFRRRRVWTALSVTALGWGAVYAPFTYIAPLLTHVSHFSASAVPWLLVLFGLGLAVGNPLGGRAADRSLTATILGLLVVLTVLLVVFDHAAHEQWSAALTLFALGVVGFATVPAYTSRVISAAGGRRFNVLASSAAVAAFNLGNASGAFLGGRVIAAGDGFASPALVGAAMAAAALVLAAVSAIGERHRVGAGAVEAAEAVVAP